MKLLYAIQGTGNGHVARAREILPELNRHAEVDVLVSGTENVINLNQKVDYQFHGLSFVFGKRGGIDYLATLKKLNPVALAEDIARFPAHDYDAIVSDFEPISAWAGKLKGVPTFALSHQASFLSSESPRPEETEILPELLLKHYAPADEAMGFHFKPYDTFIHTPIVRSEVRKLIPSEQGHYTVYLPAYDDQTLVEILLKIPDVQWQVFSKHNRVDYEVDRVNVRRINNDDFLTSLAGCTGLLCGAGFEAPSEALFLGKKLMVVPMTDQYEQKCNAAALLQMGVPVLPLMDAEQLPRLVDWVKADHRVAAHFPDNTKAVIEELVERIRGGGGIQEDFGRPIIAHDMLPTKASHAITLAMESDNSHYLPTTKTA